MCGGCSRKEIERAPLAKPGGAVVASSRSCEVCGTTLTGHPQQRCCPARFRATKSRQEPVDALALVEESLTPVPVRVCNLRGSQAEARNGEGRGAS
jgi:hypothetical protein